MIAKSITTFIILSSNGVITKVFIYTNKKNAETFVKNKLSKLMEFSYILYFNFTIYVHNIYIKPAVVFLNIIFKIAPFTDLAA